MPYVVRSQCTACKGDHLFCLDDIFSMTGIYEYICPDTKTKGRFAVSTATNRVNVCPDGSVKVTRRNRRYLMAS